MSKEETSATWHAWLLDAIHKIRFDQLSKIYNDLKACLKSFIYHISESKLFALFKMPLDRNMRYFWKDIKPFTTTVYCCFCLFSNIWNVNTFSKPLVFQIYAVSLEMYSQISYAWGCVRLNQKFVWFWKEENKVLFRSHLKILQLLKIKILVAKLLVNIGK